MKLADEGSKKKAKQQKLKKPKDATKKPARKERAKAARKMSKDFKKHMKRGEIMEDPDLDKEIDELFQSGLKNQLQTLQLSRLMGKSTTSYNMNPFPLNIFHSLNPFSSSEITNSENPFIIIATRWRVTMSSSIS